MMDREASAAAAASDPLAPTIPSAGSVRPSGERVRAPLDSIIPGTIAPGTLIGGSYRLMDELGRGAMGVVLLALDERLQRRVAIKFIRSDVVEPGFYGRFTQEARAMARVNHPNVLCIYAFGEHEGTPYFVSELVEGVTLEAWLAARRTAPDLETALRILDDVCKGVAAIHAAGTVHRDLKPSNILVDSELRTRVADFGVSTRYAANASVASEMAGTPAYMAPEVAIAEGKPGSPSPLSDIYSLGCIAFELLVGRRPFQAQGEFSWIVQHATQPVPVPSSLRHDLPRSFDRVLMSALAKNPAERTQSIDELRRGLSSASHEALEPERILVAEDDEDFRDVLRTALRGAFPSADVECVADGRAALEALERKPASVALIDLRMPVLDGVALTAALRQRESSARMPIIVLTGRGGAREWQALSSMGADRFLVKPVNLDDVVTLIRRSLRETL
ncbi:MAG TPA: protein kinase, partial [Polyangiaceae bacterium]|nr:protein kinase [Polyangiaceae bacterium]